MARKWSNENLPGALQFVTTNCADRLEVFHKERYCQLFLQAVQKLKSRRPFKLVAYVLMPDHCHLLVNPAGGQIIEFVRELKGLSARSIIDASDAGEFFRQSDENSPIHRVWQESFKALALWSNWMIWQKINYIHSNPIKAHLVRSAEEYRWSSFRAFYQRSEEPLPVDRDWWWPDDVRKLSEAAATLKQV